MDEQQQTSELGTPDYSLTEPDQTNLPRPLPSHLGMIRPPTTTIHHKPNQNQVIDLNSLPPETTITPYHQKHPQNTTLYQTPDYTSNITSPQINMPMLPQNPNWKSCFTTTLPNPPFISTLVINRKEANYYIVDPPPHPPTPRHIPHTETRKTLTLYPTLVQSSRSYP